MILRAIGKVVFLSGLVVISSAELGGRSMGQSMLDDMDTLKASPTQEGLESP